MYYTFQLAEKTLTDRGRERGIEGGDLLVSM
jgi:hypothetical protein